MLVFELACGTTKNECIGAWAVRGIDCTTKTYDNTLLQVVGRDIIRNVIDRSPKVEQHLCACHRDNHDEEPPFHGNNEQLEVVRTPVLKGDGAQ